MCDTFIVQVAVVLLCCLALEAKLLFPDAQDVHSRRSLIENGTGPSYPSAQVPCYFDPSGALAPWLGHCAVNPVWLAAQTAHSRGAKSDILQARYNLACAKHLPPTSIGSEVTSLMQDGIALPDPLADAMKECRDDTGYVDAATYEDHFHGINATLANQCLAAGCEIQRIPASTGLTGVSSTGFSSDFFQCNIADWKYYAMKYYSQQDVLLLRAKRQCSASDRQWDKSRCESTVLTAY